MVTLKSLDEQIQIQIEDGQNLLLGRLDKCDIHIEDSSISSQHARIKYHANQLRVVDMDSTNGTRLNYSLLSSPVYLLDGDTIEFGNVTFVVDGPGLTSPEPNEFSDPSALTSLEPIEASQELADTMISPDLSEENIQEAEAHIDAQVEKVENVNHNLPVHLAFAVAIALILLSGFLMFINSWQTPAQF